MVSAGDAELQRRQRRRRARRPPLLRLARTARWPRPLLYLLGVVVFALASTIWPPLIFVAALLWAIPAAGAVLDAHLRGAAGLVAGAIATVAGPLGVSVIALARRRSVRKVAEEGYSWGLGLALLFGLAAGVVGYQLTELAATRGPHGMDVPAATTGLAPRIQPGDRLLVVPVPPAGIGLGDLVIVERFPAAAEVLGPGDEPAGIFRIVAEPGEVVVAVEGIFYRCTRQPDMTVGIQLVDGCAEAEELSYLLRPTPDFGPVQVPLDAYWVMSDNREVDDDSRAFGPVPIDAISERVVAVLWPPVRFAIR